jgi:hypothetical protein
MPISQPKFHMAMCSSNQQICVPFLVKVVAYFNNKLCNQPDILLQQECNPENMAAADEL